MSLGVKSFKISEKTNILFSSVLDNNNNLYVVGYSLHDKYTKIAKYDIFYNIIAKIKPNGDLDTNFGSNFKNNQSDIKGIIFYDAKNNSDNKLFSSVLDNSNNLYVSGLSNNYNTITKINSNGELYPNFGSNFSNDISNNSDISGAIVFNIGNINNIYSSIIDNNNIYIIGVSGKSYINYNFTIGKLTLDGKLDSNFGSNFENNESDISGVISFKVNDNSTNTLISSVLDSNKNLYVTGWSSNNNNTNFIIGKLDLSGVLDSNFGSNFENNESDISGIISFKVNGNNKNLLRKPIIDDNNNLYIVGYSGKVDTENTNFIIVKLNSNGELYPNFGSNFSNDISNNSDISGVISFKINNSTQNNLLSPILDNSNNLYVVGSSVKNNNKNFIIAKLDSNGVLDTNFGSNFNNSEFYNESNIKGLISFKMKNSSSNILRTVSIDSNNNLYITGYSTNEFIIVKMDSNGNLDKNYNINDYNKKNKKKYIYLFNNRTGCRYKYKC